MNGRLVIYASSAAAPMDAEALQAIGRQAALNNAIDGISGVLVGDGHRFAQLIFGSQAAMSALMPRLEADERHRDMEVKLDCETDRSPLSFAMLTLSATDDDHVRLLTADSRDMTCAISAPVWNQLLLDTFAIEVA